MRTLVALVCLLVSTPVFAQESRVILSQLTSRVRDGVVTIPTATLPILSAADVLTRPVLDNTLCRVTMTPAVYEDPATSFALSFYKFEPSYQGWRRMGRSVFNGIPGGYTDEDGNVITSFEIALDSGGIRGRDLRCELETERPLLFAAEVEHLTVRRQ